MLIRVCKMFKVVSRVNGLINLLTVLRTTVFAGALLYMGTILVLFFGQKLKNGEH